MERQTRPRGKDELKELDASEALAKDGLRRSGVEPYLPPEVLTLAADLLMQKLRERGVEPPLEIKKMGSTKKRRAS